MFMLAKKIDKIPARFDANWIVQEKIDGIRCMWVGDMFIFREGGKVKSPFGFTNYPIDGELFSPHGKEFAKNNPEKSTFYAFDFLMDKKMPLRDRLELLFANGRFKNKQIKLIPEFDRVPIPKNTCEGYVLKDLRSQYIVGRSEQWLKLLNPNYAKQKEN